MSGRAYYGPNPRPHGFIEGLGAVPLGPRSYRSRSSRSNLEEGETFDSSSNSPSPHPNSINAASETLYPGASSGGSSYSSIRYQPLGRGPRISETRSWESWDSQSSHEWHGTRARQDSRSATRERDDESHFSARRSRSRSPSRRQVTNANLFSRRGHIFAGPDDTAYSTRASSPGETPPYVELPRRVVHGCRCPVSEMCPHRERDSHDCRPLVPSWHSWMKSHEEDVEIIGRNQRRLNVDEAIVHNKLRKFVQLIGQLEVHPRSRKTTHDKLMEWMTDVQSIEFSFTQELLTRSAVLAGIENFLSEPQAAFRMTSRVPIHFEEDLTYLFRKWTAGDLDNDIHRGLLVKRKSNGVCSFLLDRTWEHFKEDCNYFGDGNLVNGQRWPGRFHKRRDAAHGSIQAGIYGPSVEAGAQALVMGLHGQNCNYYADRDEGDRVKYIGTARKKKGSSANAATNINDSEDDNDDEDKDKGPTRATRMLMTSIKTGKPVRMFRSDKLPDINPYRPLKGYRYDGLYKVVSSELLEDERQIYGFELRRLPGQGPIRRHDMRTFEETPEEVARRVRRNERSASYRLSMRQYT